MSDIGLDLSGLLVVGGVLAGGVVYLLGSGVALLARARRRAGRLAVLALGSIPVAVAVWNITDAGSTGPFGKQTVPATSLMAAALFVAGWVWVFRISGKAGRTP